MSYGTSFVSFEKHRSWYTFIEQIRLVKKQLRLGLKKQITNQQRYTAEAKSFSNRISFVLNITW